jgi:hypothetical protein
LDNEVTFLFEEKGKIWTSAVAPVAMPVLMAMMIKKTGMERESAVASPAQAHASLLLI